MFTFGQLKDELRPLIFPAREASNLVAAHDKMFVEAMVDLQRTVDCLQYNNTNIFPQCATYFQCGMSVFQAPRGAIKRLWVVDKINPTTRREDANAPLDWCSRIDYKQVHKCDIQKYVSAVGSCCGNCGEALALTFNWPLLDCGQKTFPAPTDVGQGDLPLLPMGLHYPQSSTDSRCGRARRGVWAIERGRIYVAPWIQSTETIVVEWDGIKRLWDDSDILEDDPTVKRAVRYFVMAGQAKDYDRDDTAFAAARQEYDVAVRDLIWECRQETMVRGCEDSLARQSVAYQEMAEPTGGTTHLPDGTVATPENQGEGSGGGGVAPGCEFVFAPELDPPSGSIVSYPIFVVMASASPGAKIYYTTDGSEPTTDSIQYSTPPLIASTAQVRAIAVLGECESEEVSSSYVDVTDAIADEPPALTTLCTDEDRAGAWYIFTSDGSPDINWSLSFDLKDGLAVKRLELYETNSAGVWTTGRVWATDYTIYPTERGGAPFSSYPLVILSGGIQLNSAYSSSLGLGSGSAQEWSLFGESVGVPSTGLLYKLKIILNDNAVVYCNASVTCVEEEPACDTPEVDGNRFIQVFYTAAYGITSAPGVNPATDGPVAVVTGTWVLSQAYGDWILGQVTATNADGSVSLDPGSLVTGVKYAPRSVVRLEGVSVLGGLVVEGCFTVPEVPVTTTTTTSTSTSSTTTSGNTCVDCEDTYRVIITQPGYETVDAIITKVQYEDPNICQWVNPGPFPAFSAITVTYNSEIDSFCMEFIGSCTPYGSDQCPLGEGVHYNWSFTVTEV